MYFVTLVLKNLLRRKIRTSLTVIGNSIAVLVVICLVGISTDFRDSLIRSYEKRGVDLIVVRSGRTERLTSKIDQNVAQQILAIPGVAEVEGGLVEIVSSDEANLTMMPMMGRTADSFLMRELTILKGRVLRPEDTQSCLLGALVADQLNKQPGDTLELEGEPFKVLGVYESYNSFDNSAVMVLRSELQRLFDSVGQVTGFSVRLDPLLDDPDLSKRVETQIEALDDKGGKSWNLSAMPTRDFMNTTVQMRAAVSMGWVTSAIALFIGAVGMLNTMLMSVFERTKEIGILRALGWRKSRILAMILLESFALSAAGAVTGIVSAWVLVNILHQIHLFRIAVPPHLNLLAITQGCLIAVMVGAIGGIYPAMRAMQIAPTEAIRHE
ncbi:MAG: ABC transporter permease [Planctomycetaceae bacterium]|nr:ABC transporter permease [Planctomycetaceae bacterium]